ncbi:ATPase [Mycolicibacterium conceptionense]|uniref:ATPase n=1 Tax=Mycolicibacterium conceptionense TaxID=451644 RepID=A0A1A1W2S0_9MYCO|nr:MULTISPECIES: ParA family protein [Mycolicibacterium]MCW1823280.1 ParA family protein [Mycolicibacterium senegalense]OBB07604.1 ATPase [Mycolicibacterium conceptionense]OBF01099.1 ATPase [Mycolicibacterium conceptionense]OBF21000.1 ATPase [Mycolicibacterium conceptionense]OBF36043.1 ATPase [Mycolicibacterium conceptionense]
MVAVSVLVLSGKGGTAKTLWQMMLAGEASRAGISTLLVDADPERNLSNHFGVSQHSTGLGSVLEDADISFWGNPDKGAKRIDEEIIETRWPGIDLLPAGASLGRVAGFGVPDTGLLRAIFDAAGIFDRYDTILIDTGGRTGSLEALAMQLGDVAYAPITPTLDAVRKAREARDRVERIQRTHPLRWCGVVLSGFDRRNGIDQSIRERVETEFGDEVRAEVPRRAVVNEAFQLGNRLGDYSDPNATDLARIFRDFLERDLLGRNTSDR